MLINVHTYHHKLALSLLWACMRSVAQQLTVNWLEKGVHISSGRTLQGTPNVTAVSSA